MNLTPTKKEVEELRVRMNLVRNEEILDRLWRVYGYENWKGLEQMKKPLVIGTIALSLTACGESEPATVKPVTSASPSVAASHSPSPTILPSPSLSPTPSPTTAPASSKPSLEPTIQAPSLKPPAAASVKPVETPKAAVQQQKEVYYANCTDAKNHGAYNIRYGDPGYRSALDRDNDGVACEK